MFHPLPIFRLNRLSASLLVALSASGAVAQTQQNKINELDEITVAASAEEENKQSLGVSIITSQDLEKNPPASDLAELIRREPGVNLTGGAASGMRGNRRQIDIRGMGPDNTLVLIDGRPANSRNASRQGWTGERDTAGDTSWVPPESVERIEVIRGPAAARYGSGAMGGVVNIITKKPTDKLVGSVTTYANFQNDSAEGDTRRATFNLAGPLAERIGFRLYGGADKTKPDALDINAGHSYTLNGVPAAAGKTGNRNKYINGLVTIDLTPEQTLDLDMGFNRKSDLYSGDTQNLNGYNTANNKTLESVADLYGSETTRVYRNNFGLTHRGNWDWGVSRVSLSHTYTRNSRATEGLFGGPEGAFMTEQGTRGQPTNYTAKLKEWRLDGEATLPVEWFGLRQVVTVGGEAVHESLDDAGSTRRLIDPRDGSSIEPESGTLPGRDGQSKMTYKSYAAFIESNMAIGDAFILTPALRLNHHNEFGFKANPGVSASYMVNDHWTIKGGIARAYKTPNLYQANPNYLLYSAGIGCRAQNTPCFLQGNSDLKSETSINKEIGVAFDDGHVRSSLAYFRNDYKNKVVAGVIPQGNLSEGLSRATDVLRWENTPKAVVSGLEGNLLLPLSETVDWNTNVTYMISSKDKTYNQPLSIIPKFTVNSSLDWQATSDLDLQANVTVYGKQEPATFDIRKGTAIDDSPGSLGSYALFGLNMGYRVNENFRFRLGVTNLFDKKLYREGLNSGTTNKVVRGAGARTYNEHGRGIYVSLTGSF